MRKVLTKISAVSDRQLLTRNVGPWRRNAPQMGDHIGQRNRRAEEFRRDGERVEHAKCANVEALRDCNVVPFRS